jgi:ankyrin repeat protein
LKKLLTIILILALSHIGWASSIHQAATEGELEEVKKLLIENSNLINTPDNTGRSPLHSAAYAGKTDVVRYLIEMGADLSARTNSGSTPLHGAAFYGHREAAFLLIDNGIDVNIANDFGYTPLLSASAGGHLAIVQKLIQAGADKNARSSNNEANALLMAGSSGNTELVDYFLDAGFDPNSKDIDGEGLLHYAAYGGDIGLIKRLLDQGIDINIRSNGNVVPLHYAALAARRDAAEYMLEQGADPNIADDDGEAPLHEAIIGDWRDTTGASFEIVKMLIDHGADINHQTNNGLPPMFWTIYNENIEMMKYLLEHGADANIASNEGVTALHEVILRGFNDYVDLLLKHGARIDMKEEVDGFTPLHLAALRGKMDVVKSIISGLDDINVKDNHNHTALYYASKYGHRQVADLLKSKGAMDQDLEINVGYAQDLKNELADREAVLWYLGHCGWAIKTKSKLLIFDYWERSGKPTEPCLANGHILPAEIKDENVYVFVSHEHRDHYDSTIFSWANSLDNITYIFGFHPENLDEDERMGYAGQQYEYIDFNSTKTIDDIDITTIRANDAGQGFLVKADGLSIYHAGDHAGWREGQREGFTSEIDFLAGKSEKIDFAFVNVTGCHVRDTIALAEATYYTIDKLNPQILVPTHGIDREEVYKAFAEKIHGKGYDIEVLCPNHRGDKYVYKSNQVM